MLWGVGGDGVGTGVVAQVGALCCRVQLHLSFLLSAASPEPGGGGFASLSGAPGVLSCTGEIPIHPSSFGILPGAVDAPWDPLSPTGAEQRQLQEFGTASGGTSDDAL